MAQPIETPFGTFIETSPGNFEFYNPPAAPAAPATSGSGPGTSRPGGTASKGSVTPNVSGAQQCPPGYKWDSGLQQCVVDPAQSGRVSRIYIPGAYDSVKEKDPFTDPTRKPVGAPEGYDYEWNGTRWELVETGRSGGRTRAEERESARAIINNLLSEYGLSNLTDFVNDLITKEDIISGDIILGKIRQTEQYKARFAGNIARRNAGFNVLSEAEYIQMENAYRQLMRASGLPAGFYDQSSDFNNLIGGDVSAAELSSRINDGYLAVQQADPQVIAEMKRLYPVGDAELAAYFLDPAKATPMLLRQARSAQIAAEATMQAGRQLGVQTAEELATAGITQEQARAGFQTIAGAEELFVALPGTTEEAISQQEQISGVFGTSAAAQQRIRQRSRERQAAFEAGGRFAGQGTTVTGLQ